MNAVFLTRNGHTSIFFTNVESNAVCLICHDSVAVFKKYNLKRHFQTKHIKANKQYEYKTYLILFAMTY